MIIQNNQVTTEQLKALQELKEECLQEDGASIPLYEHILKTPRELLCNFLYVQNNRLIGFLSAFRFYTHAFEIALLVSPEFRKQNIARKLLKKAITVLQSETTFDTLIFSTPQGKGEKWLAPFGGVYLSSEFELARSDANAIEYANKLVIEEVKEEDIPHLVKIDHACFNSVTEEMTLRFKKLIVDRRYTVFLARFDSFPIGKAHIRWDKNKRARFSDIGILPAFQKKGYGKELLSFCINHANRKKVYNLFLEVESKNKGALKLYTDLGFRLTNAYDYWSLPLKICMPLLE
ncbi:N-terminal acetyltransferase, GNAT family (plasmid) [Legionella adelaidensis]|uniref:N-terminal acetyltransferase, GNAT family n=1 Tax=Legionella adelaidensis TaxID=45056 RepID=A0A0W0R0L9_9GAMM|nr:GNAT family N-acetyltransferase [Legionella adelaidensis]KTC64656.1 hypothetical protein Lade_1950 [Legionella adelaidensis]VEH86124.1 N-terminal acetyltransferase, GNAT family [Legionella adelaidensis]